MSPLITFSIGFGAGGKTAGPTGGFIVFGLLPLLLPDDDVPVAVAVAQTFLVYALPWPI